jgi:CubicO group peptidase (beta-lactamase class C family)
MATGASVVSLVESGRLSLQTPATEYFGAESGLDKVTVGQLLTHVSGLPPWAPLYDNGLGQDAAIDALLALPRAEPGKKYAYSCLGFILLQRIVEIVSGSPLNETAKRLVFGPLGLDSTGFGPDLATSENIAPTIAREGPGKDIALAGTVHDGNARGIGGVSGNAGLFGTARDVALFGEAVRSGSFFGRPARARIFANQVDPAVGFHSLLFFAYGNPYCPTGDLLSPRTVGHSGFTGTVLTIDPEYDLVVAVLTNSVYGDGKSSWLALRRSFLNTLAASIE